MMHRPNCLHAHSPIAQIAIGQKVYIKNLRTRDWELGEVFDYWELGRFLEVRCGRRLQMVFSTENIGVEGSM